MYVARRVVLKGVQLYCNVHGYIALLFGYITITVYHYTQMHVCTLQYDYNYVLDIYYTRTYT